MIKKPFIFDCTIRDGGYVNDWKFTDEQVYNCYESSSKSGTDYCEIGFKRTENEKDKVKFGKWYFCTEDTINNALKDYKGCKVAVMAQIGTFSISDFTEKKNSKIDMVRVLMAYHGFNKKTDNEIDMETLKKGIQQMQELINMGYEVTFNIGRIDKLTNIQLKTICEKVSKVDIKYFYMADTYSSLDINSTKDLIVNVKNIFNELNTDVKIGFHAHNSMQNGTSKAIQAIKNGVDIIDGTVIGYGRGPGNAALELILIYLNQNTECNYKFQYIFEYADKYLCNYKQNSSNCNYNLIYVLASYYGCHVNYAIELIEKQPKMPMNSVFELFNRINNIDKNNFYYNNLINDILNE